MKRKGFTIIELLMVIGIIAILTGLVTTAASSSIKASRKQKANALCALVQTALSTYREQKGEWPVSLPSTRTNREGPNGNNDPDKIVLNSTEVRNSVKALIDEAKRGNPMMDISGLFVSRQDNEIPEGGVESGMEGSNGGNANFKKVYGMDFMTAIHGTKQSQKKMKSSEMYFGYPDPETGYFLRFKMVYSIPADQITVKKFRD